MFSGDRKIREGMGKLIKIRILFGTSSCLGKSCSFGHSVYSTCLNDDQINILGAF